MTFVDTNYFLRFLLRDQPLQRQLVRKLFDAAKHHKLQLATSTLVLVEIYWVLSSFYGKNKIEIAEYINKILKLNFINIPERGILQGALSLYLQENIDLEDAYNLVYAKNHRSDKFATFDKKAAKLFSML